MSYYNIPERPLDPPEPRLRKVYTCQICTGAIYEGEDYYDIPGLGPCCEGCVEESKCYEAEFDREED